jgi:hypothetical protein
MKTSLDRFLSFFSSKKLPGLPDFNCVQHTKTGKKKQNDLKKYQMAIKYFQRPYNRPKGHKTYQHFPLQDPPKFTQIGIFGSKTNHLASLKATYHPVPIYPGGIRSHDPQPTASYVFAYVYVLRYNQTVPGRFAKQRFAKRRFAKNPNAAFCRKPGSSNDFYST